MDTRLVSLLLLLLLPGVLSLSVSLDSLTSRQLRAALQTESGLSVYWCKSQVATVLPLSSPLSSPLLSSPLRPDQIINCLTLLVLPPLNLTNHKFYYCDCYGRGGCGGCWVTQLVGKQRNEKDLAGPARQREFPPLTSHCTARLLSDKRPVVCPDMRRHFV